MSSINKRLFKSDIGIIQYASLLLTFCVLFIASWVESANIYEHKLMKVDSGKGLIYCFNDELSNAYWSTVEYIKNYTQKGESLVVIPEGASINFYSDRNNPTKYLLFHRQDFEKIGEDKIISGLDKNNVKYIVILNMVIDGDLQFGIGYAMKLSSWIRDNYEPVATFGTPPLAVILKIKR
jgi:hypothetical protein